MNRFKVLSQYCHTKFSSIIGIVILCILAFVSVFHFVLFNSEMDVLKQRLDDNHKMYMTIRWHIIKTVLMDTDQLAKLSAKMIATDISNGVSSEYPDKNVLRQEFETDAKKLGPKFNKILIDNIDHKYFLDIENHDNSVMILTRSQVLADMNPSKNTKLMHSFDDDFLYYGNNNESLYRQATAALVNRRGNGIIFYEPYKNDNSKHIIITNMRVDDLKPVFMNEGLDGLRTYIFLAPAYITDHGDIFGIPDFDSNGFTNNHKMIVVQRFSIVDVIEKIHPSVMGMLDRDEENAEKNIKNEMAFKAINYLAIACVNIFALLCMIFFLSYLNRKQPTPHEHISDTNVK